MPQRKPKYRRAPCKGGWREVRRRIWAARWGDISEVPCHWGCGTLLTPSTATLDHEPPLTHPDGQAFKAVLACHSCNQARGEASGIELRHIGVSPKLMCWYEARDIIRHLAAARILQYCVLTRIKTLRKIRKP